MVKTIPSKSCPRMTLWYRPLYQFHVQRRSLPKRSMTLLSMDKVSPARDCVAALFCKAGLRCSTACLIIAKEHFFEVIDTPIFQLRIELLMRNIEKIRQLLRVKKPKNMRKG